MLKLYNTVSRKKEVFTPLHDDVVRMYCCGLTVYNYAHIGNLRSFLFEDFLRRILEYSGYSVCHVMNITDVGHLTGDVDTGEDKMSAGARREKKSVWDLAQYYIDAFRSDMKSINLLEPNRMPRATDHIVEMIFLIEKLEENGFTYSSGGNIYFDTSKFDRYCDFALLPSHEDDKSRVDYDAHKKNQRDFALWFTRSKFDEQEMKWKSPWGVGYPGWHIECSAMSMKYLGLNDDITKAETFDIHCGGIDHIPVHHTNEIAQSECVTKKKMARFWLHNEFVVIGSEKEKMAKSGNNFVTLSFLIKKGFNPLAYRYFVLGTHYRSKLSFSEEALSGSQNAFNKLKKYCFSFGDPSLGSVNEAYKVRFLNSLQDDINTPQALAVVWDLIKDVNLANIDKAATIFDFDKVLGLDLFKKEDSSKHLIPLNIMDLANQRQLARVNKNWEEADRLRVELLSLGYEIKDTDSGYELSLLIG